MEKSLLGGGGGGVVGGEEVAALFEQVVEAAAGPALAGEAFEDVHLGADEAAAGIDDAGARVLALAQQGAGVVGVERGEAVELGREVDEVGAEAGDVAAALLVQLEALLLEALDLARLGADAVLVRLLLVVHDRPPAVEVVEQRHLEGAVDGLGEDLLVVGDEVDARGGEQ